LLKKYRMFEQKHPYLSLIGETLLIIVLVLAIIYAFTGKVRTSGLIIVLGVFLSEMYDIYKRNRNKKRGQN